MADSQTKIYFVYSTESDKESPSSPCEKHDDEKGLDESFSEVFGVLKDDGFHWCHANLGDGACADEYENLECRLEVWGVQTRNQKLEELNLLADDILISDIYEIHAKHLDLHPNVTINIPVNLPKSYVPTGDLYDFYIKVVENGEWVYIPATYKNGCVRAHLDSLQMLTAVARLKPEQTTITPEGAQFVSDKDPDVKLEFPEGAVDHDVDFKLVTETVDQKRSSEYRNYNPETFKSVVGFSTTVNVEHNLKGSFNKGVKVTLPIHECGEGSEEAEVVFLRWHDNQLEIVEDVPTKEENCYSISVRGFSAYSAVKVRSASVSRSEILTAARFLSGRENLCTLLCFLNFKLIPGMPVLLVDVVESCRAADVAEEHRRAGLEEINLSRSRDLPVADRERIRIELGGDLAYAPGIPKHAYTIVFIKAAKKNHVTFPLKIKVSSTPFSIITFTGHMAKWSHRVHFNATRGPKSVSNLLTKPKTGLKHRKRSGSIQSRTSVTSSSSLGSSSDHSDSGSRLALRKANNSLQPNRLVRCNSASSSESTVSSTTVSAISASMVSLSSISEDGVFEEKRHPVLCEKSLLVLSEQLPWSEWQKMAIELEMSLTQLERISEEAMVRQISPAFRMLHKWMITNNRKADRDLVNDLACAFRELGRNDLADVVMGAEKERMPLRRRNFNI